MSETINGIGLMEARAEQALAEQRYREIITQRQLSPEVSKYNDRAQLEIFGSGLTTYTNEHGDVIASPDKPLPGILEEIKSNRRYGKTEVERINASDQYANEVKSLISSGLELCQAKLVMDLRQKDVSTKAKLISKTIQNGNNPQKAKDMADQIYARRDAKRLQLIRDGGAFTAEDYQKLREGRSIYSSTDDVTEVLPAVPDLTGDTSITGPQTTDVQPSTDDVTEVLPAVPDLTGDTSITGPQTTDVHPSTDDVTEVLPAVPVEDDLQKKIREAQLYSLDEALEEAQIINKYAGMAALKSGSAFRDPKSKGKRKLIQLEPDLSITDELFDKTRDELEELRIKNHNEMRAKLEASGADVATINAIMKGHDITFARAIGLHTRSNRVLLSRQSSEGLFSKQRVAFYDWWARQGGGGDKFFSKNRLKGTIKKAAVIGAIGIPAGVLGALVAPAVGGAVGFVGAAAAVRVTGGVMRGIAGSHINKRAEETAVPTVAREQAQRQLSAQVEAIESSYGNNNEKVQGPTSVTDQSHAGAYREIRRNQRRVVASVGAVAIGAVAGGVIGSLAHSGAISSVADHLRHVKPKPSHLPKPTHLPKPSHSPKPITKPPTTVTVPSEQSFRVTPGAGIINEINNYATEHGKSLSGARAYDIYLNLAKAHGRNIIGLNGPDPSTYMDGSDIMLSHPGIGHWDPGVEAQLNQLLGISK